MRLGHKARIALIGTCAVLVALVAIAFAVGGSTTKQQNSALLRPVAGGAPIPSAVAGKVTSQGGLALNAPEPVVAAPGLPAHAGRQEFSSNAAGGGASGAASSGSVQADSALTAIGDSSSLGASRIVKTGNLTIRVPKAAVSAQTSKLVALATSEGGYVASSSTNLGSGSPYGEVILRIPVAHFEDAIAKAQALGHTVTLTRSAADVTGKYVDLNAKMHALERTRSTYLSIESRARTIGATLAVQQRIDDVQQQIDQLHGQLKLLGNQSSYSTLTVDVVPAGVTALAPTHHRDGLGKAWHDSWSRFGRGFDAIVGAIGPIVFAVLLLAVVGLIGVLGYRGARRVLSRTQAAG